MAANHKSWSYVVSLILVVLAGGPALGQAPIEDQATAVLGVSGSSAYLVELASGLLAEDDPLIKDGTFSSPHEVNGWLRGFVPVERWSEFQERFPEAVVFHEEEFPSEPDPGWRPCVQAAGGPDGDCETETKYGVQYEKKGGDVTSSPTWPGQGVRLSAGLTAGWTQYRWYLPMSACAFTELSVSGYLKDIAGWPGGDGPMIRVYNWDTIAWDSVIAGTSLKWYTKVCNPTIGKHISPTSRNVLFRVDADWNDDTDLWKVKAYYCEEDPPQINYGSPELPTNLDFGKVAALQHSEKTVKIINLGGCTLSGEVTISSHNPLYGTYKIMTGGGAYGVKTGESHPVTVRFTAGIIFPPQTASGTLKITSNDPNRPSCSVLLTGIAAIPPDLVVTYSRVAAVGLPSSYAAPGWPMRLDYSVKNQGEVTAANSTLGWYISVDPEVNQNDYEWVTRPIPALSSQQTHTSLYFTGWPTDPQYSAWGKTYYVRAMADCGKVVTEANENNNWGELLTITIIPEPMPDLIIESSGRAPASGVDPGDRLSLDHVVKNIGNASTKAQSHVAWYISTDSNVTTSDYRWTTAPRAVPAGLEPDKTSSDAYTSEPWPANPPYGTLGETYYVAVMADANKVIPEQKEDNNFGEALAVTLRGNEPPVANAGGPYSGTLVQGQAKITFDGSKSYDPDGTIEGYRWDFKDNGNWTAWSSSAFAEYTYTAVFHGQARLEVKDNNNATATATADVDIYEPGAGVGRLTGTVRDTSGSPIVGARVALTGGPSTQTLSQGEYTLNDVSAGEWELVVTKSGYYTVKMTVWITKGSTKVQHIQMTPDTGFGVVSVNARYCGTTEHAYYLDGVSLNETFTATIEWGSHTPGSVQFKTPQGTFNGSGSGRTWTYTLDMGSDFGPGGTLTVVAITGGNKQSEPYVANFKVIAPPVGILASSLYALPASSTLKYVTPKISVNPTRLEQGVEKGVIPGDMPLFGQEAFKFAAMFDFSAEVDGNSGFAQGPSFSPQLPSGQGKTKLAGFEFGPQVSGQATWQFDERWGWVPGGYVQIGAKVGADVPPVPIVFFFGPVPCYFRGHVDVGMAVGLDITGWTGPDQPTFDGHLILDPFPYAEAALGAGVANVLAVEGYLGGGARMKLNYPYVPPEPVLEELKVFMKGGVRVVVFIFTYSWPLYEAVWDVYGGLEMVDPGEPILGLMPRDYLNGDVGYAVFVANEGWGDAWPDIITREIPFQLNVYAHSTPDLTAIGDDLLTAWIYDDPARTATNRTEVCFAKFDAGTGIWTEPVAVYDDGTADFHPQIAGLPNEDALLAWENVSEVLIEPGAPGDPCIPPCVGAPNPEQCRLECKLEELKSKTEIAVAGYDAATHTWGPQTIITNNGFLDHSPRLVTASNGTALLTWISNEADDELGSIEEPNDIYYTTYYGSGWLDPATVATGVPMIIKTAMAYNGADAVLLLVRDMDNDQNTLEDRELFATTYDGSTWTAVTRLTTDAVQDANPQIVYDSTGGLLIVWYRGGDLVMATNLELSDLHTVAALPYESSSGVADFRLATGLTGKIALVWQEASNDLVDMWKATYDPSPKLWSKPQRLTTDIRMEHGMAPVFNASGDLFAIYDKTYTVYETQVINYKGELIEVQVPVPDQTDLYLLWHRVTGDLAIRNEDVKMTPPNPQGGETVTISALVRNLGDVAAKDVEVGFYDGDPGKSGTLIDMAVIPGLLIGGTAAEASVEWLVPSPTQPHDIYVVADPNHKQEDGNRDNNTGVLYGITKPDLLIDSIRVQNAGPHGRVLTIRVANGSGAAVSSNFDVTLRRDALNGELLATLPVTQTILPGAYYDVSWVWEPLPPCEVNVDVYAIADEANVIEEFNETNNTRMTVVPAGPEFMLYDMNYDGFISIIGDVPPFVDCLYFGNCNCPEPGCVCPGDCNGDGFLSIIGDVPCFVDCLYFGKCGGGPDQAGGATGLAQPKLAGTYTIGGAVFTDLYNPLMSGLEQVTIEVIALDAAEQTLTTTVTGSLGIWQIADLPEGRYAVSAMMPGYVFRHASNGVAKGGDLVVIQVNPENQAANQSVQFYGSND